MCFLALIVLTVTLLICTVAYFKWKFLYWHYKNVPYVKPTIPFGTSENPFNKKHNGALMNQRYYRHFKSLGHRYGGLYSSLRAKLLLVDVKLIRNVMSNDFQYFSDRGLYCNETNDPLSANLFCLEGHKWRTLRGKLTPTFTSVKLKMMFPTLVACSEPLQAALDKYCRWQRPIDAKEVAACFTIDVIGSCAFGIECNSFKNPHSDFRKYSEGGLSVSSYSEVLKTFIGYSFPSFGSWLGLSLTNKKTLRFFLNIVEETITYRKLNNIHRDDFMQMMMDLRNQDGTAMSIVEITAQAYVFFFAGHETSAVTTAFCLYELAVNQEIQDRLRREIHLTLAQYGGKLTYEAINEMQYLSNVIDETLRKYPPGAQLPRVCVEDYQIPDTDVIISKGSRVIIPIYALHHDPEFFPYPDKFDPDRFKDGNRSSIVPFTYLPFGEGPRICIGLRFGLLQTKMSMLTMLKNFKFVLNHRTQQPMKFSARSIIPTPEGGIWLNVEKASTNDM